MSRVRAVFRRLAYVLAHHDRGSERLSSSEHLKEGEHSYETLRRRQEGSSSIWRRHGSQMAVDSQVQLS